MADRTNQYSGNLPGHAQAAIDLGSQSKKLSQAAGLVDQTIQTGMQLGGFLQKFNAWQMSNEIGDFQNNLAKHQAEFNLQNQRRPGDPALSPVEQSELYAESLDAFLAEQVGAMKSQGAKDWATTYGDTFRAEQLLLFDKQNWTDFVSATIAKSDNQIKAYENLGQLSAIKAQLDREVAAGIRVEADAIRIHETSAQKIVMDEWKMRLKMAVNGDWESLEETINRLESEDVTWTVNGETRALSQEQKENLIAQAKNEDAEDLSLLHRQYEQEDADSRERWEKTYSQSKWWNDWIKKGINPIEQMEKEVEQLDPSNKNRRLQASFVHYSRLFQQRMYGNDGSGAATDKAYLNQIKGAMADLWNSPIPPQEATVRAIELEQQMVEQYEEATGKPFPYIDETHGWVKSMDDTERKFFDYPGITEVYESVREYTAKYPGFGGDIDASIPSIIKRNIGPDGKPDVQAIQREVGQMMDTNTDNLSVQQIESLGKNPIEAFGIGDRRADTGEKVGYAFNFGAGLTDRALKETAQFMQGDLSAYNATTEQGLKSIMTVLNGDRPFPNPATEPGRHQELHRQALMVANTAIMEAEFEKFTDQDVGRMISADGRAAVYTQSEAPDGNVVRTIYTRKVVGTPDFDTETGEIKSSSDLDYEWEVTQALYGRDGTLLKRSIAQNTDDLTDFVADKFSLQERLKGEIEKQEFGAVVDTIEKATERAVQANKDQEAKQGADYLTEAGFPPGIVPTAPADFYTRQDVENNPEHAAYAGFIANNKLAQSVSATYNSTVGVFKRGSGQQKSALFRQMYGEIRADLTSSTDNAHVFNAFAPVWKDAEFQKWAKKELEQETYDALDAYVERYYQE